MVFSTTHPLASPATSPPISGKQRAVQVKQAAQLIMKAKRLAHLRRRRQDQPRLPVEASETMDISVTFMGQGRHAR